MSKRGRPPIKAEGPGEKRSKPGAKSDMKPEAGKRGAAEPGGGGRGTGGVGSKKSKKSSPHGSDDEGGEAGGVADLSVKLLELPQIMPPPPCLFLQAILSPNESGALYPFEGWSLNQLDGLGSDFDHISRVVADLEPMLTAELEKMDAVESEAGGLPLPCVIEGSAGGGGQSILAAPEDDGNAAASAASGGGFADSKSDSLIHSASSSNLQSSGRNVEDSYVDEDDYPVDEDDEDEDDYRASVPSTTSGPKKPPARNSFWGWMEQYFVPFGPQHLALLRETKVAGDPSFQIPRLGTHYAEKWGEDDGHARAGMEERPRIGEMTARVLAALVVTDVDGASKKPKRRPDAESMKKARADEAGAGVPFSKELAASVDDKLRAVLQLPQLQPLGLPGLPAAEGREDDEICETIRSLQSQLKQQIKVNNALKAELRPVVEKRMELQAKEEETKKEWAVALARYDTLMSTKRKK